MIKLEGVNKYFNKGKRNEIHVIKNTTLEFEKTGLVALLGPSGCGKTTLLNVIGGLDKVQGGKVFIDGEQITGRSSSKIDEIRSRNIGYIFQNYNLVDNMTVFENVAMVLRMNDVKSKTEIREKVNYALEMVGMYRYRNRYADMLSGGERQRVGIARAIVKDPAIIIADEPTGNLDSRNTIEVMNIIRSISRKRLVILVTHEEELANFYAGRIIRLRDGEVISDEENEKAEALDYRIDNKIYLKDLARQTDHSDEKDDIMVYSDSDKKVKIDIVVKDGNIYIRSDERRRIEVVDDASSIDLIDDHYHGITQEDFLNQRFETRKLAPRKKPRYTSIIGWKKMIRDGFRKVSEYKPIKKIILVGFFFSALFIIFALSNIAGVMNIEDKDFTEVNKDYLKISEKKINPKTYTQYEDFESVGYVLPGNSQLNLQLPYDSYLQTANASGVLTGSLTSIANITDDDILYGRMPKNKKEIVVDKLVLDRMAKEGTAAQAGMTGTKSFLGKLVKLDEQNEFYIVGVTDREDPNIYTDPSLFLTFIASSMSADQAEMMNEDGGMYDDMYYDESEMEGDGTDAKLVDFNNYDFDGGVKPVNDYEVVVSDLYANDMKVGKTISKKVNGHKLKVVGYYEDSGDSETTLMLVNSKTLMYSVIEKQSGITVYAEDKEAALTELRDAGFSVSDPYAKAKKEYIGKKMNSMKSALITAAVILLISFFEIYLIMRASFLSRIKEIGIYRAIGVKKKDIYKMFLGEILAITTLAGIPGFAFGSYILYKLTGNEVLAGNYVLNPLVMLAALVLIFLLNIVFGLLPVARTIRQVPAQILARTDVD